MSEKKLVVLIDGLVQRMEDMAAPVSEDEREDEDDVVVVFDRTQTVLAEVSKKSKWLAEDLEAAIKVHEKHEREAIGQNHVVSATRETGANLLENGKTWQDKRDVQTERLRETTVAKGETADLAEEVIDSNDRLEALAKETNDLNKSTQDALWWDKFWIYTQRTVIVIFAVFLIVIFIYLFASKTI